MAITFDPAKRTWTLANRDLDFLTAAAVFDGPVYNRLDNRRDYGEPLIVTAGLLDGRLVIVGWTPRGADRHVFTMRKANAREQARLAPCLR